MLFRGWGRVRSKWFLFYDLILLNSLVTATQTIWRLLRRLHDLMPSCTKPNPEERSLSGRDGGELQINVNCGEFTLPTYCLCWIRWCRVQLHFTFLSHQSRKARILGIIRLRRIPRRKRLWEYYKKHIPYTNLKTKEIFRSFEVYHWQGILALEFAL